MNPLPPYLRVAIHESNSSNPNLCSFCYNRYSYDVKVMKVEGCNHIFCCYCRPIFESSRKCEVCGKSPANIRYAYSSIQQLLYKCTIKPILVFNVQNSVKKYQSFSVCLESSCTLLELVEYLYNNTSIIGVQMFVIKTKSFDMAQEKYKKMTLKEAGIEENLLVRCVNRSKGGL